MSKQGKTTPVGRFGSKELVEVEHESGLITVHEGHESPEVKKQQQSFSKKRREKNKTRKLARQRRGRKKHGRIT